MKAMKNENKLQEAKKAQFNFDLYGAVQNISPNKHNWSHGPIYPNQAVIVTRKSQETFLRNFSKKFVAVDDGITEFKITQMINAAIDKMVLTKASKIADYEAVFLNKGFWVDATQEEMDALPDEEEDDNDPETAINLNSENEQQESEKTEDDEGSDDDESGDEEDDSDDDDDDDESAEDGVDPGKFESRMTAAASAKEEQEAEEAELAKQPAEKIKIKKKGKKSKKASKE